MAGAGPLALLYEEVAGAAPLAVVLDLHAIMAKRSLAQRHRRCGHAEPYIEVS
jgi:hypothetical protein